MYVDPFWCGVLATLAAEFVTLIIMSAGRSGRRKNGNSKENN